MSLIDVFIAAKINKFNANLDEAFSKEFLKIYSWMKCYIEMSHLGKVEIA